jgi:hypothetical protein
LENMDHIKDLENTLIELYEAGLVKYWMDDEGNIRWDLTTITREAMRLGLDVNEIKENYEQD